MATTDTSGGGTRTETDNSKRSPNPKNALRMNSGPWRPRHFLFFCCGPCCHHRPKTFRTKGETTRRGKQNADHRTQHGNVHVSFSLSLFLCVCLCVCVCSCVNWVHSVQSRDGCGFRSGTYPPSRHLSAAHFSVGGALAPAVRFTPLPPP